MSGVSVGIASVELLSFRPQILRADLILHALGQAIGNSAAVTKSTNYQGGTDLLCLWGPGAPDRFGPMLEQQRRGGRVACFDLAYWDRDRKVRVSIDRAHPQHWLFKKDWPRTRLEEDGIVYEDSWNPNGPVVVAGIGRKAQTQYGDVVPAWEDMMWKAAVVRGRKPLYRAKPPQLTPAHKPSATHGSIEHAIRGASVVCTYHSNVAIDALRLGIPVICQDGAASAICPSEWPDNGMPQPIDLELRDKFFRQLAWFQWSLTEAPQLWAWLQELLA